MTMPASNFIVGRTGIMPPAVIGKPQRGKAHLPKPETGPPLEPVAAAVADTPALIVLGRDEADRPHASWFTADEAPLATKAAGMMEMVTLPVEGDALAALAQKLPHGRVFASGKAFVPFVRGATFDELVQHLPEGVAVPARTARPIQADRDTGTRSVAGIVCARKSNVALRRSRSATVSAATFP